MSLITSSYLISTSNESLPPVFGGELPGSLEELRPVIHNAFGAWLQRTESLKTRIAYRKDVLQFLNFHRLDPDHLEQLTRIIPEDVTLWRDHLLAAGGRPDKDGSSTPAANSTVARKITALRSFFSYLQVAGYRGGNPAHPNFVKTPTVSKEGKTPAIHPKLIKLLLEESNVSLPVGQRDQAILAIFAYMALRVDELHHVNVGNIARDGEHTIIRIKSKGNTERKGVLPPAAAAPVNAWINIAGIEHDRTSPLFRPTMTARGQGVDGFKRKRLSVRSIQELVGKYFDQAGIDAAATVHSTRVTACTEAHNAGVPLVAIQKWMGHADPRTTLSYIRTQENMDQSPAYVLRYV